MPPDHDSVVVWLGRTTPTSRRDPLAGTAYTLRVVGGMKSFSTSTWIWVAGSALPCVAEEQANSIREDVRRRDEELLALQAVGDWEGSRRRWHTKPVTPEPLVKPPRQATRLDKGTPEPV